MEKTHLDATDTKMYNIDLRQPPPNHNPHASRRSTIISTAFATSIFWLIFFSFQSEVIWNITPSTITLNCGNSTAEARALGCVFDPLVNLWVPAPCIDNELNEDYKRRVDWRGFDDPEGKKELDLEAMSERVDPFHYYTTIREHAVHCAYVWRKQHQGYLKGGMYLDGNSASLQHTKHCADMLIYTADLRPGDLGNVTTETTVGFSTCVVPR